MKNSLLFAILLVSNSVLAQNISTSSPHPELPGLSSIEILPLLSSSDNMSGAMADTQAKGTPTQHGYPRLLLMLIPASLLGTLYIIVKKQKLYIEAIPMTQTLS